MWTHAASVLVKLEYVVSLSVCVLILHVNNKIMTPKHEKGQKIHQEHVQ